MNVSPAASSAATAQTYAVNRPPPPPPVAKDSDGDHGQSTSAASATATTGKAVDVTA